MSMISPPNLRSYQSKRNDISFFQIRNVSLHLVLRFEPICLYIYIMTTLRYQVSCEEQCTAVHSQAAAKRHKEIPLKRLKVQIDEFLSEDDWLWQQAITIDSRLQEIVTSIQKLRREMMQKVYEKKLAYALQWDTADNIATSIKLARDGKFDQLTCANIFRINEKLEKGRKIDNKEVVRLTKEIINDTKIGLNAIVERCFQGEAGKDKKRYEKEEERDPREEEEEILRYAKGKQPKKAETPTPTQPKKRVVQPQFGNSLPTVKINKIEQIVVKVLRIVKQFMIGRIKKVQFIGGDQTGTATLVLDESRCIRRHNVISISRARIFLFHGIKQIQNTDKGETVSIVKELDVEIQVDQDGFHLSGKRREDKEYTRPYRGDREYKNDRQDRPRRGGRGERRKASDDEEEEPQNVRTTRRPRQEPKEQPTRPSRMQDRRDNRYDSDEDEQPQRTKQSKQDMYSNKKNSEPSVESSKFNRNKKDSSSEQQRPTFKKQESQKTTPVSSVPFQATKIAKIEPGDQKLNLIAEVLQIRKQGILGIKPAANYVHCIIGDDTGISRIQLPKNLPSVKQGAVLKITSINADVDTDHRITLKLDQKEGLCERTTIRFAKVNKDFNLSLEIWESEEEDEPIIEDF